ncbi:MAG: TonB-dependent siderophore receptor [Pseudomonadota bacterium]
MNLKSASLPFLSIVLSLSQVHTALGASKDDTLTLEQVEVVGQRSYYDKNASTASRIDLANIETPQSVFVINSDLIADQQAFRFDQILQNDSSVQKSNNFLGAYSSYKIRGFDLSNGSNYLRDGRVFFHLASVPTEVLDRVEVLKGPSSVLYGTMAPGGLINMIPKRPSAKSSTSIKGTMGSYDFYHAAVDHSGNITRDERIRYRINGAYESSNSFREFIDSSDFDTERKIGAFALDWDLSENSTIRFNYDYTSDDRPQDIGVVSLEGDFAAVDYDLIYNQPWSHYNSEVSNYFIEFNHAFTEGIRIRAGYSFQDYVRDRFDNQLRGVPSAAGDANIRARRRINRRDYETYFVDFMADFRTGVIEHQLMIGIDKTDTKTDNNETAENVVFATNVLTPSIIANPNIQVRAEKNLGNDDREGISFHDVISIGEHWRFLVGGRLDSFESEFTPFGIPSRITGETNDHFTPRLGGLYLLNPHLSFYLSYSESFEPNAPVSGGFENDGELLDPTLGAQWEAGLKWEAYEGKLLFTGAAFSIERKDAPFQNQATNTIDQRGTQEHEGLEFSIAGLLTDNITLTGSGTFLDAEFTEDDNPLIIGNTPFGVSDVSLAMTGEYEFLSGTLAGLSLQASLFYESARPVDDLNSYDLDSYLRIDLGAKYVQTINSGGELVYRLSALNVADEEYFKGGSPLALNPEQPLVIRGSLELLF